MYHQNYSIRPTANSIFNTVDQPDKSDKTSSAVLAASLTRAASRHTDFTIRFLVDRDRVLDAYRAYGYFRWVDDWLDKRELDKSLAMAFVERQQFLVDLAFQGKRLRELADEEHILFDLVQTDHARSSPLQAYIRNMMRVMAFDAERRWQLISSQQLNDYTHHLAVAVTEALHYFIGHDDPSPFDDDRYCAVTAAHITHLLRDTLEDVDAGYFNISREFLDAHRIQADQIQTSAYREWVKNRVQLARSNFQVGRDYLLRIRNIRCRLAGYAYMACFESVLDSIERNNYQLLAHYPRQDNLRMGLNVIGSLISHPFDYSHSGYPPETREARTAHGFDDRKGEV